MRWVSSEGAALVAALVLAGCSSSNPAFDGAASGDTAASDVPPPDAWPVDSGPVVPRGNPAFDGGTSGEPAAGDVAHPDVPPVDGGPAVPQGNPAFDGGTSGEAAAGDVAHPDAQPVEDVPVVQPESGPDLSAEGGLTQATDALEDATNGTPVFDGAASGDAAAGDVAHPDARPVEDVPVVQPDSGPDLSADSPEDAALDGGFTDAADVPENDTSPEPADGGSDGPAPPTGVYVSAERGDDGNPGTPAAPVRTIGQGIRKAVDAGGAQTVFVGQGHYAEKIALVEGVSLLGGHECNASACSWARDRVRFESVLDAIDDEGLLVPATVTRKTWLDGFRARGKGGPPAVFNRSAAITVRGGTPTVSNNVIVGGPVTSGTGRSAGLVFIPTTRVPNDEGGTLIEGNYITGGTASAESVAVDMVAGPLIFEGALSVATIVNNVIRSAQAPNTFAIHALYTGPGTVVRGNQITAGGGQGPVTAPVAWAIKLGLGSTIVIDANRINGDQSLVAVCDQGGVPSTTWCGGIWVVGAIATITNNVVAGVRGPRTAALHLQDHEAPAHECIVNGNVLDGAGGGDSGSWVSAAVALEFGICSTTNCGIRRYVGRLRNNILLGGSNPSRFGVYEQKTTITFGNLYFEALTHNDFWFAPRNGRYDVLYRLDTDGPVSTDITTLAMLHAMVPTKEGPAALNISADPLFDGSHISASSPCIDTGTAVESSPRDLDGDPRPGPDGLVDIGPDEANPTPGIDGGPPHDASPDASSDGPPLPTAIYVAADPARGDDANPGTPAAPVRTIAQGLNRAMSLMAGGVSAPTVYVANGSYAEKIALVEGISLLGGYECHADACTWTRDWGRLESTLHAIDDEGLLVAATVTRRTRLDGFHVRGKGGWPVLATGSAAITLLGGTPTITSNVIAGGLVTGGTRKSVGMLIVSTTDVPNDPGGVLVDGNYIFGGTAPRESVAVDLVAGPRTPVGAVSVATITNNLIRSADAQSTYGIRAVATGAGTVVRGNEITAGRGLQSVRIESAWAINLASPMVIDANRINLDQDSVAVCAGGYCGGILVSSTNATITNNVVAGVKGVYTAGLFLSDSGGPTQECIVNGNTFDGAGAGISAFSQSAAIVLQIRSCNNCGFTGYIGRLRNNILIGGINGTRYGVYELTPGSQTIHPEAFTHNDIWFAPLTDRKDVLYRLWSGSASIDLTTLDMLNTMVPTKEGSAALNINANPALDSTWHLDWSSPCVDQGTTREAPAGDFDGDPRPLRTGVDIGHDEVP